MAGEDQQYDATQLDEVQHPQLGPLKFPKDMPFEERNQHIEKLLAAQPKTAQPKGAMQRFTESFRGGMGFNPEGTATGDIQDIGTGFKQMATHPIESGKLLAHGIVDPMQATYESGMKRMAQPGIGNKLAGGVETLESGVPLIGPWLAGAGHQFESGDIAGGMGTMAPAILGPAMEKGINKGIEIAPKIGPALERRSLAKATKETKTAAPPARQEIDYNQALEHARPYLAEEQRRAPVKSVREAHDAANAAIKNIESKVTAYVTGLPDVTVSGPEILDAARERLRNPDTPRTPAEIQAGMRELEGFGLDRDLPLKAADRLRYRFNQDLESEMGMTEADRAAVRASNPKFAAKEAAVEALRDGVYDKLEENGVEGIRKIRQDEGRVIQMRDAFRRNIVRSEKENAPSSFRRLGVFGPVGLGFLGETVASRFGLPPGVSAATGIGTAGLYEYMRNRLTPNPTISRAFRRFGRSSERPSFPEAPPQRPTEAIGTPIEPTTPNEPPNAGEAGGNEPLTPRPEAGYTMREEHGPLFKQGIGEPIQAQGKPESTQEMDIRRSGPYQGEERRISQEPIEEERRGPFAPGPPKQPQVGTPELLAAERERGQAAIAAEREEPEAVETKVKGITTEEPKSKAKREIAQPVEKLYSPDEITDAEGLINSEVGAMQSGERPGRYFDESTEGTHVLTGNQRLGIDRAGGSWRGVKSGRDMFPFMREHPDWSPTQLEKALRNKDSALYKKAVGAAVEFIRREDEAERAAIQEESKASIAGEPIFPGMGRAMAEQAQGAAQVRIEDLTRRMNEPRSIESAAGEMETKSPLFRGTAASPQNEMFGQPIEPEVMPRPGMAEFLRSGGEGERPAIQGPQGTIERLQFHRQNIVNLEERLREETQAGQREDAKQTRRELEEEREFMRRAQQGVQTQP